MPHAVPRTQFSHPTHKHKAAMARSQQQRQRAARDSSASPPRATQSQAPEAWQRVARTHADLLLRPVRGDDRTSSASESSVSSDPSSDDWYGTNALRGWQAIDHHSYFDAATQPRWPPAAAVAVPITLTRAALLHLDTAVPAPVLRNDLYSPSPNSAVISYSSSNFSDIDHQQRGSTSVTHYADDERYSEVSPTSSLWASDPVDDHVSDIVVDKPSPVAEPGGQWAEQPSFNYLQLDLSPPDLVTPPPNDFAPVPFSPGPPVFDVYAVQPISDELTQFVIETPSGPPVVTPEYRKMADHLADWVADSVWKLVNGPNYEATLAYRPNVGNKRKDPLAAPTYLAENIRSILLATLLQPSAVFLALWYIKRLPVYAGTIEPFNRLDAAQRFRQVLFGEGDYPTGSSEKHALELYAPFKLFVNGVLLASKMLDDTTFSNKVWHEISQIAICDINALELASLELLEHDLTVPPQAWAQWLETLQYMHLARTPFPAPIGPARETPHGAISHLFDTLIAANNASRANACDGPVFLGIEERIAQRLKVMGVAFDIDEMDDEGPLRAEYRPRRSSGSAARPPPPDLPAPAEWFPAADPIVSRRGQATHQPWPTACARTSFLSHDTQPLAPPQYVHEQYQEWSAAVGYHPATTTSVGFNAYTQCGGFSTGYCTATYCA